MARGSHQHHGGHRFCGSPDKPDIHRVRSTATDVRGRRLERSHSETTRGWDDIISVQDMDRRVDEILSRVDPEYRDEYLHRTESTSSTFGRRPSQRTDDLTDAGKLSAFDGKFDFDFCGRQLKASAVHVAALHVGIGGGTSRLMQLLVERRADLCQPGMWMEAGLDDRECFSRPVHLAAAAGNCGALEALHRAGAPIACTSSEPEGDEACDWEGNSPLHEAVQFLRPGAVELLLRLRADPAAANFRGSTPLHLAAQQGSVQISQILLGLRGDVPVDDDMRRRLLRKCRFCEAGQPHDRDANGNKVHETALMVALSSGQFPYGKLFLLAERRLTDILQVARACPEAASYLMRDPRHGWRGGGVHASWRRGVLQQLHRMRRGNQYLEGAWIELLERAPPAAEDLLEAVTVTPQEENSNHNPLPMQALLRPGELLRSEYCAVRAGEEPTWGFRAAESASEPAWQRRLVPRRDKALWAKGHRGAPAGGAAETPAQPEGQQSAAGLAALAARAAGGLWELAQDVVHGKRQLVPVRVKVVRLPGLLSARALHALASTRHLRVFSKLGVRASVDYIWMEVAFFPHLASVVYRVVETALLFLHVLRPDLALSSTAFRRVSWSWLVVMALRDLTEELLELLGLLCLGARGEAEAAPAPPSPRASAGTAGADDQSDRGAVSDATDGTWSSEEACRRLSQQGGVPGGLPHSKIVDLFMSVFNNYMCDIKNAFDVMFIGVYLYLMYKSSSSLSFVGLEQWLAFVCVMRWVQLVYALRAFECFGHLLLPITQSLAPTLGIFCITVFVFVGFMHAFMAFDVKDNVHGDKLQTVLATFRFLFLGDGQGIDDILDLLGGHGSFLVVVFLIACTIVFCVWILNLFLALTSEAYDKAQEQCLSSFQQERLAICIHYMFHPSCPRRRTSPGGSPAPLSWWWRFAIWAAILVLALPAWLVLAGIARLPVVVPSVLLFAAMFAMDAATLQHSWLVVSPQEDRYLWICHRTSYSESEYWISEQSGSQVQGRTMSLKQEEAIRSRRLTEEIKTLGKRQEGLEHAVNSDLGIRVFKLEQKLLQLTRLLEHRARPGQDGGRPATPELPVLSRLAAVQAEAGPDRVPTFGLPTFRAQDSSTWREEHERPPPPPPPPSRMVT